VCVYYLFTETRRRRNRKGSADESCVATTMAGNDNVTKIIIRVSTATASYMYVYRRRFRVSVLRSRRRVSSKTPFARDGYHARLPRADENKDGFRIRRARSFFADSRSSVARVEIHRTRLFPARAFFGVVFVVFFFFASYVDVYN